METPCYLRKIKKNVDHIQFHESVILFLEKMKSTPKIKKKYVDSLSPKKMFKELDTRNYKDKNIKTIIKLFQKLEKKLKKTLNRLLHFVITWRN